MFTLILLLLSGTAMFGFMARHKCQVMEALDAFCAECDAGDAFIEWRSRNPGVYVGLSAQGRMLIGRWLEAHDWFIGTHTHIDGRERREWIMSLLDDFPPKSPDSVPIAQKGVQVDALSVFTTTGAVDENKASGILALT